jgi:penicillin-binding protein A
VNKPIRTMSIFCMLLFAALLLNSTYLQYFEAGNLNSHSDNKRVRDAEFSRQRGAIVVAGTSVAESRPVKDQYKYLRVYPQARKYAQLTGYYSYIYGRNAVELTQNDVLSGSDPRLFVNRVVDLFGNSKPQGGSVSLTVDPKAQTAAYDGMRALGRGVKGAVVALDPSTGKILAMVSSPSYDPNRLSSHDFSAIQKAWKGLQSDPDKPTLNRAIQEVYPPGSTFKVVTAAAALSSGRFTPDSKVKGGSPLQLPQTTRVLPNEPGLNCGTTTITLTQALENSCNVSFGKLGLQLGAAALREQAQKFGFGQTYLDDLNGQVPSRFPKNADPPQTAYSAIGQFDVAATPLQMAMVTAGIANHGVVMKPHLIDSLQSPTSFDTLEQFPSQQLGQATSSSTASEITKMMVATVQTGTATPAAIPGVQVAGKTGTAQSGLTNPDGSEVPPYAWFIGFAPAPSAKVAVAVMIQHVDQPTDEIHGGTLGGPIAKAVMEAVLNPHG